MAQKSNNVTTLPSTFLVFVYGTLLPHRHNHYLIKGSKLVKENALTKYSYSLVDFGKFPGMLKFSLPENKIKPSDVARMRSLFAPVEGNVYEITQTQLNALDNLEQNNEVYTREKIEIQGMKEKVWCYILPEEYRYYTFENSCYLKEDEHVFSWVEHQHTLDKKDLRAWEEEYGSAIEY